MSSFRLRAFHPLWSDFPSASSNRSTATSWSYNPREQALWFGLFRFRSPLLTESILFLFLRILRCFTSPRFALSRLCIHLEVTPYYRCWVSPFGYLRIKACVPLPEAFRSLLRPSSPDDAKASIICCNWFMQTHNILGVYFTYSLIH